MSVGEWEEERPGVLIQRVYDEDGDYEYDYKFHCQDCHLSSQDEAHEDFMVQDALWVKTMALQNPRDLGGVICKCCFEKRLGRQLVLEDFTLYPINEPHLTNLGYQGPPALAALSGDREGFGEVSQAFAYGSTPEQILAQLRTTAVVGTLKRALQDETLTQPEVVYWVNCIICKHVPGERLEDANLVMALAVALVDVGKRRWISHLLREMAVYPSEDFWMACGVATILHDEYALEVLAR